MTIKTNTKAFTLIELMIVIVILGLLATVIMPKIMNRPAQARRTKALLEIKNIEAALDQFHIDTQNYPTTSQGLAALVSDPGVKGYNRDGYLPKAPVDPWDNPYVYLCPGRDGRKYDIISYGKDGEEGGRDDDADIVSWDLEKE